MTNIYGKCPQCGANVVMRERRINGDDKCANGHKFPSSQTISLSGSDLEKEIQVNIDSLNRLSSNTGMGMAD